MEIIQNSLFPALVPNRKSKAVKVTQLALALPFPNDEDTSIVPREIPPEPYEEIIEFDGLKIRLTESGAELV